MKNAFNSAWVAAILLKLKRIELPGNLFRMAKDFLQSVKYIQEKLNNVWNVDVHRGLA